MRRILVVDYEQHVRLAISAWLRHCGFRVVAVASGSADGIEMLRHSAFDLMIVDVFIPGMQGFEAIRTFVEQAPAVPLIAISGYAFSGPAAASPDFVRMALSLGATRRPRKPFRPETLLAVIDDCLSEAGQHRKYVAALAAVTNALTERDGGPATMHDRDRLSAQWEF